MFQYAIYKTHTFHEMMLDLLNEPLQLNLKISKASCTAKQTTCCACREDVRQRRWTWWLAQPTKEANKNKMPSTSGSCTLRFLAVVAPCQTNSRLAITQNSKVREKGASSCREEAKRWPSRQVICCKTMSKLLIFGDIKSFQASSTAWTSSSFFPCSSKKHRRCHQLCPYN